MNRLENGGTIQNVVVDAYMNKNTNSVYDSCLVNSNSSGIIRNIQVNLKQSKLADNNNFGLIAQLNYGTIENFVVHLEEPFIWIL